MSLPYFPLYPTDFEADTSHLTMLEDGAYNRLLRLCWMTPGCSLPADDAWVLRRMRVRSDDEREAVLAVLSEFFTVEKGRYSNARLTRIFQEASEAHEKRKMAGAKGGAAKARKNNETIPSNAQAMPKQPEPEPEPEPAAAAREPQFPKPEHLTTERERYLAACGVKDVVSGLTGHGSARLGTPADMAVASRWTAPPPDGFGLTVEDCVAVIRGIVERGATPRRFAYFDGAMSELAAARSRPLPKPKPRAAGAEPSLDDKRAQWRRLAQK